MLDSKSLSQIREIIAEHLNLREYQVFIFGSRASPQTWKFSDIDIGIEGKHKLPARLLAVLDEAFEESDLPYTVDVVDFSSVSDTFKRIAKKNVINVS